VTYRHQIIRKTLGIEGGYADHKSDRGGKTRYGITEAVARRNGYTGQMRDLPLSTAISIYEEEYWDKMRLDQVEQLSPLLAEEMFDTGVNMGPKIAVAMLQRALNMLGQRFSLYGRLTEDGRVGVLTLAALKKYLSHRGANGVRVLISYLDSQQGARYLAIAERDETQQDFVYGWAEHRLSNVWKKTVDTMPKVAGGPKNA
jgi:lysozyme family protein